MTEPLTDYDIADLESCLRCIPPYHGPPWAVDAVACHDLARRSELIRRAIGELRERRVQEKRDREPGGRGMPYGT